MKTSPTDFDGSLRAITFIAGRYHVTLEDLEGHCREWRFVWPRWLAIHLVRNYTSLSLSRIALLFNRDKGAIRYALAGIERQIETSCAHGVAVAHLINAYEASTAGQRRMKTKTLKRKQKRQPGGSLKPISSEIAAQLAAIKARGCFRCDGTKELCNVCGESARACQCPEDEASFMECPNCKTPNKD